MNTNAVIIIGIKSNTSAPPGMKSGYENTVVVDSVNQAAENYSICPILVNKRLATHGSQTSEQAV